MTTPITTRAAKGQMLIHAEIDANFVNLRDSIDGVTSSHGAAIAALQAGQSAGSIGFTSYATMQSSLNYNAGTNAWLAGDADPTKDGPYIKTGASGSGSWTKSAFPNSPVWINANSYTDFNTAVSAQSSNIKHLIISASLILTSNISTPSTLIVEIINGGGINLNGFTLTFGKQPTINVESQVFFGSGSVTGLVVSKPQWFGAVGDGVTLDTSAVQKAINSSIKKIVVDRTHYIDTLTMSGSNLTLDMTNGGFKKYSGSSSYMLAVSGDSNTIVGGLWDGNRANVVSSYGEYAASCVYVTGDYNLISGATFSAFKGCPIRSDDANFLTVEKNKITDTVGCGMLLETASNNVTGLKILHNYLDTAIFVMEHTDGATHTVTNSEISGNTIDFTNTSYVNAQGFHIGITHRGQQGKIHDNTIYCASKSSSMGISAEYPDNTSIIGNTIRDVTLNCVELIGNHTYTIYNTVVANNKFHATGHYGINLSYGPFNGLSITGNTFDNRTKLYLQTELAYGVTKNISITGNTFFSDGTTSFNAINFYAVEDTTISGNSFFITNYQSGSWLVYLNRSQHITVTGNTINNAQGLLTLYSSAATAYNNIVVSNNTLTSTASVQMYLQGSATWGTGCKALNNSINNLYQYDILDAANNILVLMNSSYSTPESYISAGVGSTYRALYNGTLWYKHTGTGNTGWKQVTLS